MSRTPAFRLAAAAAAALTLAVANVPAQAAPYSGLYVFGDSLSDTGRVFSLTGTPPAPYYQGRYSNGMVGVEYLAQAHGLSLTSYAWGGATTGQLNISAQLNAVMPTGVLAQVAEFGTAKGGVADPNALYFVMAGPNDFFSLLSNPATTQQQMMAAANTAVGNLTNAVGALYGMGARNFLLPLMPDLGLTVSASKANAVMPGAAAGASQFTMLFNSGLAGAYGQLGGVLAGEQMFVVDTLAVHRALLGQFSKGASTSCLDDLAFPSCAGYAFFDDVHPTTAAHRAFAQAFINAVPEPSSWMLGGLALLAAGVATRRRQQG